MSRHRNVKQMVEEDYYDYYDEYEDDGYVRPPPKKTPTKAKASAASNDKPKAAAASPKKTTPAKQQQQQQQQQHVQFASKAATPTTSSAGISVISPVKSEISPVISTVPPSGFSTAPPTDRPKTPPPATAGPPPLPEILRQRLIDSSSVKPTLTCVILGHVDAGKSTLTGRLLWSQQQQGGNTSKAPENFAWLLDEDEQERAHGITMEVATKTLQLTKYHLILQDAPGHKDYVPNMIAGTAAGVDAAVAVVDVTDSQQSALLRGQLREHLILAKGLGVNQIICALNKMDVLDWNESQYQSFVHRIGNFLFHSAGFNKQKVSFIPISGITGVNVCSSMSCSALTSWYNGPTLWQAMEALELPGGQNRTGAGGLRQKLLEKPLRFLLTDILQEQGKGRVAIRAKLVAGWMSAQTDIRLLVLPYQDIATVSKLNHVQENLNGTMDNNNSDNERSQYAVAGDLVDLVISGVDVARLSVGHVMIRPSDTSLVPATIAACRIYVLESVTIPIIRGAQAMFHIHSIQVPCYISKLTSTLPHGKTEWKDRPRALTQQSQALVEITLQQPTLMEAFADCRALARFVLRRGGESIAVGRIEKVKS